MASNTHGTDTRSPAKAKGTPKARPVPAGYVEACDKIRAKKKECQSELKKVRGQMKQESPCGRELVVFLFYLVPSVFPCFHATRRAQEQRKLARLRMKASRLTPDELQRIAFLKGMNPIGTDASVSSAACGHRERQEEAEGHASSARSASGVATNEPATEWNELESDDKLSDAGGAGDEGNEGMAED